jgi:hypothetical protein
MNESMEALPLILTALIVIQLLILISSLAMLLSKLQEIQAKLPSDLPALLENQQRLERKLDLVKAMVLGLPHIDRPGSKPDRVDPLGSMSGQQWLELLDKRYSDLGCP